MLTCFGSLDTKIEMIQTSTSPHKDGIHTKQAFNSWTGTKQDASHARAATIKYHRVGDLNNRVVSQHAGGWPSKIKVDFLRGLSPWLMCDHVLMSFTVSFCCT